MKYKCLICGQIIESNDMCPICGSDSSQIVPLEEESGGHFRCLVCGRESDDGDYCPYCGSQRLFNLDTKQSTSRETEFVEMNNVDSTNDIDETPNEEFDNVQEELSLKEKYYQVFGETLPLDFIKNPAEEVVDSLYRMGLNRGSKITSQEVLRTFKELEPEDDETTMVDLHKNPNLEVTTSINKNEVEKPVATKVQSYEKASQIDLLSNLLQSIDVLMHFSDEGNIAKVVLNEIKERILDEVGDDKEVEELQQSVIENMEALVNHDKENNLITLESDEKYLKLIKTLFGK